MLSRFLYLCVHYSRYILRRYYYASVVVLTLVMCGCDSFTRRAAEAKLESYWTTVEAFNDSNADTIPRFGRGRIVGFFQDDTIQQKARHEGWRILKADSEGLKRLFFTAIKPSSKDTLMYWTYNRGWGNIRYRCNMPYFDPHDTLGIDSSILKTYHYFGKASDFGMNSDLEAVSYYARSCLLMSRFFLLCDSIESPISLLHKAIYAAERSEDWPVAYRAYTKLMEQYLLDRRLSPLDTKERNYLLALKALQCYNLCRDNGKNFQSLLSDLAHTVLNLHLSHQALEALISAQQIALLARERGGIGEKDYEEIYKCISKLNQIRYMDKGGISYGGSQYLVYDTIPDSTFFQLTERRITEEKKAFRRDQIAFMEQARLKREVKLSSRLVSTMIACAILVVSMLAMVIWYQLRLSRQRRTDALLVQREQEQKHLHEKTIMAEQLRQKEATVQQMRGCLLGKTELLERLNDATKQKYVISAREWQEIEMTLDHLDNFFVNRLRATHPDFSEDDIHLCMLTRLKLSNRALSNIYLITVSAIQHRKLKLKREGFKVTDPAISLEKVIENL